MIEDAKLCQAKKGKAKLTYKKTCVIFKDTVAFRNSVVIPRPWKCLLIRIYTYHCCIIRVSPFIKSASRVKRPRLFTTLSKRKKNARHLQRVTSGSVRGGALSQMSSMCCSIIWVPMSSTIRPHPQLAWIWHLCPKVRRSATRLAKSLLTGEVGCWTALRSIGSK